jgi:hypothetical protein
MYVDAHARAHTRAPEFILKTFYGQLEHIFVVPLLATADLGLDHATTLWLAAIRNCKVVGKHSLDIHFYKDMGKLDVVDITCVQCLVARIWDEGGGVWAILDRSGSLARALAD